MPKFAYPAFLCNCIFKRSIVCIQKYLCNNYLLSHMRFLAYFIFNPYSYGTINESMVQSFRPVD
ncbi:hypothetical protein DI53_2059 [Sphingobacterium deserti]|uniref:Uncharacterized protein n=1 Tax=Sphingobacterium deserti TaxID=1229276 RepID=A0A0B8T782_9SPHI|nr:hypothetical protein DI53_2059 [Sphingobacterium deserti]